MEEIPFELPAITDGEDKSSPLKNCIRNNYRHVRKWAKRSTCNAFRLYDRQISQYLLAIDYYDGRYCLHYFSQEKGEEEIPEGFKDEVESVLKELLGAFSDAFYWRTRFKRARTEQYEKAGREHEFFPVIEYGVKFWINLVDYLDTGLFLDHREMRRMVAEVAKGKRVLNLFAYTGAFSVHAAKAGAIATKSVDMSNTYTDWCRQNFLLNDLSLKNNEVVRADCLKFLEEERGTYDIIVIDPPTLSRSKKMDQMFDVQRDYQFLIQKALKLLAPEGQIFFSTNARKFVFDETAFEGCAIRNISHKTIPLDFHNDLIHKAWIIKRA